MDPSITLQDGIYSATRDNVTITTYRMANGLPQFPINTDLFKVFPHTRQAIIDYILSNHKQQPITVGDTYRKHGRCWMPNKITAQDSGYCPFTIGTEDWGFYISSQLHVASFTAFNNTDIIHESHHKCHVKCCCNPDHITDMVKSNHLKLHVAEKETIDESQLYHRGPGLHKITNPMALFIRYLAAPPYNFNHDLLAFVFNCSVNTISDVVNRRTHELDNEEHDRIFNKLTKPERRKVMTNPLHDKFILNGKHAGLKIKEIAAILNRSAAAIYIRRSKLKAKVDAGEIEEIIHEEDRRILDIIENKLLVSYHTFKYGDVVKLAKRYKVDVKVVRSIISKLKYRGLI